MELPGAALVERGRADPAKLERGARRDLDLRALIEHGLGDADSARSAFQRIEPELDRVPAIDPGAFGARVEDALG